LNLKFLLRPPKLPQKLRSCPFPKKRFLEPTLHPFLSLSSKKPPLAKPRSSKFPPKHRNRKAARRRQPKRKHTSSPRLNCLLSRLRHRRLRCRNQEPLPLRHHRRPQSPSHNQPLLRHSSRSQSLSWTRIT